MSKLINDREGNLTYNTIQIQIQEELTRIMVLTEVIVNLICMKEGCINEGS